MLTDSFFEWLTTTPWAKAMVAPTLCGAHRPVRRPNQIRSPRCLRFGSTEIGNAGVGSDIDLIVVSDGDEQQQRDLRNWLEGWSMCLAEVSFQLYGLPSDGLLDVKILNPEQAKSELLSFAAAGKTLQALPLGIATAPKQ